jgi:hypothetical protein
MIPVYKLITFLWHTFYYCHVIEIQVTVLLLMLKLWLVEGMLDIISCLYCTYFVVIHVWGYSTKFCISSPFYFLLPVFFRHVQSTPLSSGTLPVCTTQLTVSAVKILSGKVNTVFLNVTMFDIGHSTIILYPARSCSPYVKLSVKVSF